MQINPISTSFANPNVGANQTTDSQKATLDYNAFLQLLVAQLKNQDPTEPMDASQYMAQLASFSNVEQSIKVNAKLDNLIASMALNQADGLIGKKVTSADGTITGKVVSLKVLSDGATATLDNGKQLPIGPGISVSAA